MALVWEKTAQQSAEQSLVCTPNMLFIYPHQGSNFGQMRTTNLLNITVTCSTQRGVFMDCVRASLLEKGLRLRPRGACLC